MSAYDDFQTALQAWVATVLSPAPVIFAHENGTRPDVDYVTLHPHLSPRRGQPCRTGADSSGQQKSYYDRSVTVAFYAYGKTSAELLLALSNKLDAESGIDALEASGIAINDIGPVKDVSTLIDNLFESQDIMEVVFTFRETITDTVGYISSVSYTDSILPPQ